MNVYLKIFLFSCLLLIGLPTITFAQTSGGGGGATPEPPPGTRVSKPNWANSMGRLAPDGVCVAMLQDNILNIELIVRFGRNDLSNYPALRIDFDFGGILVGTTAPITSADLSPVSFYGVEIYQYSKMYSILINDFCGIPDNIDEFSYSYSLVYLDENSGGQADPYPVLIYPDLFPPALFTELQEPGYTPDYSGTKTLCCGQEPGLEGRAEESNNLEQATVKFAPNPFRNELTLDLVIEKAQRVQIELINLQGKTVFQLERHYDFPGTYRERLDLQTLPTGVYVCRFNSPEHNQSIKVLKID